MKATSGKNNGDLKHSKGDTLKNVNGSICALEAILRRYPNASFATASNLFIFYRPMYLCYDYMSTTALILKILVAFCIKNAAPPRSPSVTMNELNG